MAIDGIGIGTGGGARLGERGGGAIGRGSSKGSVCVEIEAVSILNGGVIGV